MPCYHGCKDWCDWCGGKLPPEQPEADGYRTVYHSATGGDPAREQEASESGMGKALRRVPLWDAINEYSEACGGRSGGPPSDRRMNAVVRVEQELDSFIAGVLQRLAGRRACK